MSRSTWTKLRRQVNSFASRLGAPKFIARTGFRVTLNANGGTTLHPGNFEAVEEIKDDLENLYIWLWNAKDYLIKQLASQGRMPKQASREVEQYVNRCSALQLVADVANTAKHAELRSSRTKRFARIGGYVTSAPILLGTESRRTAERRVKEASKAWIAIEDSDGNRLGDAAEIALQAIQDWQKFAEQHGL